jgi:hypothetical protein
MNGNFFKTSYCAARGNGRSNGWSLDIYSTTGCEAIAWASFVSSASAFGGS